jgi:hypothetical protein
VPFEPPHTIQAWEAIQNAADDSATTLNFGCAESEALVTLVSSLAPLSLSVNVTLSIVVVTASLLADPSHYPWAPWSREKIHVAQVAHVDLSGFR